MNPPVVASINQLRDLTLKTTLDPALVTRIRALLDTPPPAPGPAQTPYLLQAASLVDDCIRFLDAEIARCTEQRFSIPDPNTLRNRLLQEPRRLVDTSVQNIRQKLAAERQEWARRVAKQVADVLTTIEQHVEGIDLVQHGDAGEVAIRPSDAWAQSFEGWRTNVFNRWTQHLAQLLPAKVDPVVRPDLETIEKTLGLTLKVTLPTIAPMRLPATRDLQRVYEERFEMPTFMEATFETFKGGLTTVAMIAGMVIIPVIGSLMHTASTTIRALVMGGMVSPIAVFAVLQARKQRTKLQTVNMGKARDKLKKTVVADAKTELDRFKPDAERFSAGYCNTAQEAVLGVLTPAITEYFERREKEVAQDLSHSALEGDRINEQIMLARQLKNGLSGQLLVDLKRKLHELEATTGA